MRRIATLAALALGMAAFAPAAPAGNAGLYVPAFEVLSVQVYRDPRNPERIVIVAHGIGPQGGMGGPRLQPVEAAGAGTGQLDLRLAFDLRGRNGDLRAREAELPRIDGRASLTYLRPHFPYDRVVVHSRSNKIAVPVPAGTTE